MIRVPEACIKAWKEGYETASDPAKRQAFDAEIEEIEEFVDDQISLSAMDQALCRRRYTPATGHAFMSGYFHYDISPDHFGKSPDAETLLNARIFASLEKPADWDSMTISQRVAWTKQNMRPRH